MLNEYENTVDDRIPPGSIIYHKQRDFVLFSTKKRVDAAPTAFSAFEDFGIKVYLTKNYYVLPKQQVFAKDVLQHCLWVLETDFSVQLVLFTAIFYRKTGDYIEHPIINTIDAVLAGKTVPRYPKKQEIVERARLYGVDIE